MQVKFFTAAYSILRLALVIFKILSHTRIAWRLRQYFSLITQQLDSEVPKRLGLKLQI